MEMDSIVSLLTPSTKHEYRAPKISKDNLADAITSLSHVVSQLLNVTKSQATQLENLETKIEEDRNSSKQLAASLEEAKYELSTTTEKVIIVETLLEEEKRKSNNAVKNLKEMVKSLEGLVIEQEKLIEGGQRNADRQQAVIQVLKLEVSKANQLANEALENSDPSDEEGRKRRGGGGHVDTGSLQLSSEQIFCQEVDPLTGEIKEALIPLSKVLKCLVLAHSNNNLQVAGLESSVADINGQLEDFALKEELTKVESSLGVTCKNLDMLLSSFYTAGILERSPPKSSICESVNEAPPAAVLLAEKLALGSKITQAVDDNGADEVLLEIRSTFKNPAIGAYQVTRGIKDLMERFELEVNAVNAVMKKTNMKMDSMQDVVETKLDSDSVDKKIEVRFDDVIDHLEKAIATAGADEAEFKEAARELQETCAMLNKSKANHSDILEMKKQIEKDSRVSVQVEKLQKQMKYKLDKHEANSVFETKVTKEELMQKLLLLHKRLLSEVNLEMDERQGIKPWALGNVCDPSNQVNASLNCLACNRKVTPGQLDLLKRAPAVHNNLMNKQLERPVTQPQNETRKSEEPRSLLPVLTERPKVVSSLSSIPPVKKRETISSHPDPAEQSVMNYMANPEWESEVIESKQGKKGPTVILDPLGNPVIAQVQVTNFEFN